MDECKSSLFLPLLVEYQLSDFLFYESTMHKELPEPEMSEIHDVLYRYGSSSRIKDWKARMKQ